jgi:hypothetical protein
VSLYNDWNRKAWIAGVMLALCIIVLLLSRIPGCGTEKVVVVDPPQPVDPVSCGDLKPGETKSEECPAGEEGKKVFVCNESGQLHLAVDDCRAPTDPCAGQPTKISFEGEIKQLMTDRCLGCHFTPARFDDYGVAKAQAAEFLRRVNLGSDNPQRMPKVPRPELEPGEKALLKGWIEDGLLEDYDCNVQGSDFRFMDLDAVEAAIILDLDGLDSDDRLNARYLVLSHRYNLDRGGGGLREYRSASDKALNSLSATEDDVYLASPVDPAGTILRFDLRAYGLAPSDWKAVEDGDRLNLESETTNGGIIKLLTGARKAWLHADNFIDVAFRNSAIYYKLLKTPATFAELSKRLGADFAGDLLNFDALLVGFNGSKISNQKNRLLSRHETDDGYMWTTFDTVELGGVPQRNLFEFPLLAETGGRALFQFDAGEVIYSLPNGLQGYALFDAKGDRQDLAPINIVRDTDSPVSSEIRNANSCQRCHYSGILTARDEVRDHVLANAAQFELADVEKVKELYRPAGAVAATFSADNLIYAKALSLAGVEASKPDPISVCLDRFLLDWTADEVASLVFMELDAFKVALNQSARARAQVGQLLSGGHITYDQLVAVMPILIEDLRITKDPIGQ